MSRVACLLLAVILGGCYACTAIGCNNQLHFRVGLDLLPRTTYEATACFDGHCEDGSLRAGSDLRFGMDGNLTLRTAEDAVDYSLGEGDFSGEHEVSLRLRDADAIEIAAFDDLIELTKSEPNGGWPCGPTCWSAERDL